MQDKNPVKLNIGAGGKPKEGYLSVDIQGGDVEACAWDLPYDDDSVAAIYSRHMIEHVSFKEASVCLREWYRVLEPGGTIHIICPDRDHHMKLVGNYSMNPKTGISFHEHAMHSLYGWQNNEWDFHKWAWTWAEMLLALRAAGFQHLSQNPENTDVDIQGSK